MTAAATVVTVGVAVTIAAVRASPSPSSPTPAVARQDVATSAGPKAAFIVPKPELLKAAEETRWAPVERAVVARAVPGGKPVSRLSTSTPEQTANLVVVEGPPRRAAGALWVRVRLPTLPNNSVAWVPREALGGYRTVDTRLVVNRSRLTAELFRGGRRIFSTPVGVGQRQWPTPAGRFYVRVKLTSFKSPFYGPLAFGTSARSAVLTDWPAGGFVGIHGTDKPQLLPGRVSHGCIRMHNRAILRLGRLMPIGTPVTIT